MVTDDERRRVANMLRHSWPKVADKSTLKRSIKVYIAIHEALCQDNEKLDCLELLERLAELVGVDRETLLDVLEEMDVTVRRAGPDIERGYVERWAERIRDACGVNQ